MELQKIVVLCVILTAAGAGAWYVLDNRDNSVSQTSEIGGDKVEKADSAKGVDNGPFSGLGSFSDLLRRGNSIKCEFSVTSDEGSVEGTSYIDGDNSRYRMDTTGSGTGANDTFGMIGTKDVTYWWTDTPEGKQGMKMIVPEESAATSETRTMPPNMEGFEGSEEAAAPVSIDQKIEYDCDRWRVDASVFEPPTDVTFTSMNEMMQGMMQGMPEGFTMPEGFPVSQ